MFRPVITAIIGQCYINIRERTEVPIFFFNLDTGLRWVFKNRPKHLWGGGGTCLPTEKGAGWKTGDTNVSEKRKITCPCREWK